ncbi:MAG: PH domain-containing protein [Crocinitomicaceae bacterium]
MRFASRRDNFFRVIMFSAIFICIAPLYFAYLQRGFSVTFLMAMLVIVAVTGFLLWMWHGTFYEIKDENLFYQSGPIRGNLPLANITSIKINTTSFIGLKLGLARNGLQIKSDTNINLYITPVNPKVFLDSVLAVNRNIKILN